MTALASNLRAQGEITPHSGFIIHGRCDAVLNPEALRLYRNRVELRD